MYTVVYKMIGFEIDKIVKDSQGVCTDSESATIGVPTDLLHYTYVPLSAKKRSLIFHLRCSDPPCVLSCVRVIGDHVSAPVAVRPE